HGIVSARRKDRQCDFWRYACGRERPGKSAPSPSRFQPTRGNELESGRRNSSRFAGRCATGAELRPRRRRESPRTRGGPPAPRHLEVLRDVEKSSCWKSEIRNPKSERSPKPEFRNPKDARSPNSKGSSDPPAIRVSDFEFLSHLGFRPSDFGGKIPRCER